MNKFIISFLKYGNTQKVAECIGVECQSQGTVRVLSLEYLRPADLQDFDLVIMGSPTNRMILPEDTRIKLDSPPRTHFEKQNGGSL